MSDHSIPANSSFQLSLIVTEKCNLNCGYCFCDKSMNRSMSLSTARSLIGKALAEHSGSIETLNILLIGGEPFLEFPLIRDLVTWVRGTYPEKKIKFKAVTNGTLVHGEIQEWLINNSDVFTAELSLDGAEEDHNNYRSGSFDLIDFAFFRNKLPNPVVNTVISPAHQALSLARIHGFEVRRLKAQGWYFTVGSPLAETRVVFQGWLHRN